MSLLETRRPLRRRLSVAVFRLFRWPFGVGHPPYTSYPEFQLDLRAGRIPASAREINNALLTIPGLETPVARVLKKLLSEAFRSHTGVPEIGITVAREHVLVSILPSGDGASRDGLSALTERWDLQPDDRGRLWATFARMS